MTHIIRGHAAMRNVNVRLHRPTVMPDACAEEGGRYHAANAAADAPDLYQVPSRVKLPRPAQVTDGEKVAGVLLAVSIGLVGACALVAWWTT
jgi:hypothetical protein